MVCWQWTQIESTDPSRLSRLLKLTKVVILFTSNNSEGRHPTASTYGLYCSFVRSYGLRAIRTLKSRTSDGHNDDLQRNYSSMRGGDALKRPPLRIDVAGQCGAGLWGLRHILRIVGSVLPLLNVNGVAESGLNGIERRQKVSHFLGALHEITYGCSLRLSELFGKELHDPHTTAMLIIRYGLYCSSLRLNVQSHAGTLGQANSHKRRQLQRARLQSDELDCSYLLVLTVRCCSSIRIFVCTESKW
jgi:hypothetical protein